MHKHEYLDCVCSHFDHIARVDLDLWDDDYEAPELSITVKLNPNYSFFKRLWIALSYTLGYDTKSGWEYSYVVLTPESIDRLSTLIIKWRLITKLLDTKRKKRLLKERLAK